MTQAKVPNKELRHKHQRIDQCQPQIDPAAHHRVDPNHSAKGSPKQPGQEPEGSDDAPLPSGRADRDSGKLDQPRRRENAQGAQAGSAHDPAAFDVRRPEKHGVGIKGLAVDRDMPAPVR